MADNLKTLIGRLTPIVTRAMEAAAGACAARGNYEVTIEHLLAVLLDDPRGDMRLIAHYYDVDHGRLRRAISATIDQCRTGNPGRPVFSPILGERSASARTRWSCSTRSRRRISR